jgi:hypothetical protein
VQGAFQLAGYVGDLRTLPLDSGDEICFMLDQEDLLGLSDVVVLEQVLQKLLGRKVWLLADVGGATVAFESG